MNDFWVNLLSLLLGLKVWVPRRMRLRDLGGQDISQTNQLFFDQMNINSCSRGYYTYTTRVTYTYNVESYLIWNNRTFH